MLRKYQKMVVSAFRRIFRSLLILCPMLGFLKYIKNIYSANLHNPLLYLLTAARIVHLVPRAYAKPWKTACAWYENEKLNKIWDLFKLIQLTTY